MWRERSPDGWKGSVAGGLEDLSNLVGGSRFSDRPLGTGPAGKASRQPPEGHSIASAVERLAVGAAGGRLSTVVRVGIAPCGTPGARVGLAGVFDPRWVVRLDISQVVEDPAVFGDMAANQVVVGCESVAPTDFRKSLQLCGRVIALLRCVGQIRSRRRHHAALGRDHDLGACHRASWRLYSDGIERRRSGNRSCPRRVPKSIGALPANAQNALRCGVSRKRKPLRWGLSYESGVLAFCGGFDHDAGMVNVRRVERDQLLLIPPSLSDWLPADHLAWFVVDVVAELDLLGFYGSLRIDGRGGASYDPEVMLGILLYSYCVGERSSRRIERRLCDDVAFRVVAANQVPDHATLARFRRRHQDAIGAVFAQVVALCITEGLVHAGEVAIDGTKIEADVSVSSSVTRRQIVDEILEEAEAGPGSGFRR